MADAKISELPAATTPLAGTELVPIVQSGVTRKVAASEIGGSSTQNVFSTIAVSGQSDVVADSATDTLTFAAGANITITTNAGTDTITIAASGGGGGLSDGDYGDITVSGTGTVLTIDNSAVTTAKMGGDVTTAGKAILTAADASAQRTALGLAIGTDVQAQDAELAAIAGLTSAADRVPYFTGSGTAALATFTTFGRSLVDDADAATARTTLAVPGLSNLRSAWAPAGFIQPSATGGCAALAITATSANRPDIRGLNFDATTQEFAQFSIRMPKSWDEGTISAAFVWAHPATTTNFGVRWGIQAVAVSDDDTIDVAFGTAQEVTDTGGTTSDQYTSPTTSAITVAGTPAAGDVVYFRVYRDPANGADTMAVDAILLGVVVFYTTDAIDET